MFQSQSPRVRSYLSRCRLRRWAFALGTGAVAAAPMGYFLLCLTTGPSGPRLTRWTFFALFGVVGPAAVLIGVARWWTEKRLRESLRRHDYKVCTQCGYPLNPEHEGHPCPECGVPVDLAECEREWRRFFHMREPTF